MEGWKMALANVMVVVVVVVVVAAVVVQGYISSRECEATIDTLELLREQEGERVMRLIKIFTTTLGWRTRRKGHWWREGNTCREITAAHTDVLASPVFTPL
ncbi:hypothetical protein E2C01_066338 [Portunus trituberculatus]|uniref:Uncharacterized protein n=1 Tax=Portunus trituberculatus TaxID=210409 RepID=A0A5B7HQS2_PORTR|nr:hypothetical protein [Portunus trituberculatus]